jgi:multiple sugar transport system permease protein
VIGFLFIFPYLYMILTSLRPQTELQSSAILPRHFDFSAYRALLSSGLLHNLFVTVLIAGGATTLVLLVATPAAYYSARFRFRGRVLFLVLVLVTQMMQPASLLVGIYRQYYVLGGLNTIWSLILVNAGFNMAFAVWILTAYFGSIPKELEEAAMVDGYTRLGALRRVTLPLAGPGIVTALIFTFIAAWNEFLVALTLTSTPNKQPLTVAINNFLGAYSIAWQNMFAASVVATIPVIVLFAVIERKVVSGLTAGSIK